MSGIVLILVGLLLLVNLGAMIWLAILQNKVGQRDKDVYAAQHELDALRQQAQNITMARLLMEAQGSFGNDIATAISQITAEFKRDLNATLGQVSHNSEAEVKGIVAAYNNNLSSLQNSAGQEMQKATQQLVADFRRTLDSIKVAAEKPLEQMGSMVEEQRAGFNARVQEELKKHEARLIAQFDNKVSDVVSQYLTETLGNDVDLGAQGPYLFRMLAEHKDEIKQEIVNGA